MADVVVCSTCYGDVPRPTHPGPNYCCRACEPWVLQHAHEERDQLRAENAHLLEQAGQASVRAEQAEDRAEKAERERDNWEGRAKTVRELLVKAESQRDEANRDINRIDDARMKAERELIELRALEMNHEGACVRLKRERDKARSANIDAMQTVVDGHDALVDARRERDDARDLLKDMLNHIDGGELRNTIMWTTLFQARIRKLLAGDRQGGASDAPDSTPDAGHHVEPTDWNPDFHPKETKR